jgi:hypothetical protein
MRIARRISPDVHYHLIWQFVDRTWFFTSDDERAVYLRLLGRALEHSDWRCTAYALMSNHIHIAAIAGTDPLASWAMRVNSPFAHWMNRRHDRLGPLMADRPRSYAMKSEREAQLLAYIHNNPVRAGLVAKALDSSWTSHGYYVHGNAPPWLKTELALQRFGFGCAEEFDAWVNRTPGESGKVPTRDARRAARKRGAIEVATPGNEIVPLVRRPFAFLRPDPTFVVRAAADALHLTYNELCSRRRTPAVVDGRAVAVHAAAAIGIAGSDIACALAVSPGAVTLIRRRPLTVRATAGLRACLARLELELGHK